MKIYLGADHGGFKLKQSIKKFLIRKGYSVVDMGNKKYVKTDDYPDYGIKVGKKVAKNKKSFGILFCGSAEGICIAANKIKKIRAVAVWNLETARLSREHNDANVLCLSGGAMKKPSKQLTLSPKKAENIILKWLKTEFTKEKRHIRRIKKIENA